MNKATDTVWQDLAGEKGFEPIEIAGQPTDDIEGGFCFWWGGRCDERGENGIDLWLTMVGAATLPLSIRSDTGEPVGVVGVDGHYEQQGSQIGYLLGALAHWKASTQDNESIAEGDDSASLIAWLNTVSDP